MLIGYDYQGVTMLNSKFTNNNFQRQMFGRHFSCFGEIKILETSEIFPFFFYVQIPYKYSKYSMKLNSAL